MKISARVHASAALRGAGVVLLCAVAGLAIGLTVAFKATERKVDRYAKEMVRYADDYGDEIVTTLDAVNASPFPFCSDEDIARLRTLVFHGHLVKEIGRVQNNLLFCSSVTGRSTMPFPNGSPISYCTVGEPSGCTCR